MTITESELLKHALALQAVFVQGELQARPDGAPLLCPAPLPEFDSALVLGTLEVVNTEGQYSAWIMFDLPSGHRPPDEAALRALGWLRGPRSVGPGLAISTGDTPEVAHPDPGPMLSGLYLHPETRTKRAIQGERSTLGYGRCTASD